MTGTTSIDVSLPIPGLAAGWRVIRLEVTVDEISVRVASPDDWERSSGLGISWLESLQRAIRDDYTYGGGESAYVNVDLPDESLLLPLAAYMAALVSAALPSAAAEASQPLFYELPETKAELISLAAKRAEKHGRA